MVCKEFEDDVLILVYTTLTPVWIGRKHLQIKAHPLLLYIKL